MFPIEFNLSDGSTFEAHRAISSEKRNDVLFVLYEGCWLHSAGASETMQVAINPNQIVSFLA